MDLSRAYELARANDPRFGAAFYEREASKTFPAQGRSLLLPQVQASGTLMKYNFDVAPPLYDNYLSETAGLSIRQPLFNAGRFFEARQYTIRGEIGAARFAAAEQDLILRVVEAYFKNLAAENLLSLLDSEKEAVAEQLSQAKKMFAAGAGTLTDVHDAEARLDAVLAQEVEAKSNLDIARQALARLVGERPAALSPLRDGLSFTPPTPAELPEWIAIARANHPLLKTYEQQIAFHEEEVRKAKGQHLPSVDLVAGYTNTNTDSYRRTSEIAYATVGLQLSIPIFSGGYTAAKAAEAEATLAQARKEYENALADVTQKLGEAYWGLKGSLARLEALAAAVRSAETALHSNKMGLAAGIRTISDVLAARRDLHNVQTKLLQARYDYVVNFARLRSAAGLLADSDVREINGWLK